MEIKKKIIRFFLLLSLTILGYLFGFLSIEVNSKLDYNSTLLLFFSSLVLLFTNTDINKLFFNYKNVEIFDKIRMNKCIGILKYVYSYFTVYPLIIRPIKEIYCLYTNPSWKNIVTYPVLFGLSFILPFIMALILIGIIKNINYLIMSKEHKMRMFVKTLLLGNRIELHRIVVKENHSSILKNAEKELKEKLNIDSIYMTPVSNQDISIFSNNTNHYILTIQIKYIETVVKEIATIESVLLKIQIDFENMKICRVKFLN